METLIGTWRLIREEAWAADGTPRLPFFGVAPTGLAMFNDQGRMMAVLSDGSATAPGLRRYVSYCGAYIFDGKQLVTQVDRATEDRLLAEPQVREASFADGVLTLRPPARMVDGVAITRALHWERIG